MPESHSFHPWRPHPWHGLETGPNPPSSVYAFIEITPFDLVKYEIDKSSGFLIVDRPQRTSSLPPSLYGFIPRTYCGERVRALMNGAERGDGDPLDICVLSERPIGRAEILTKARVVGGLPMADHGEADDKIIAILDGDYQWKKIRDLSELPVILVDRLCHYFQTYKLPPHSERNLHSDRNPEVTIGEPYGREHAEEVVRAAMADYVERFGGEDGPPMLGV
ncbi:MAG: inorganic pyrophosphatase [Planctomycetes bacterium]|nr:inorganic pyrophosphatase [Planctomycetota bacterium]MCB9891668.1 inorganic pyrophosphatase [Planctomycetota bacterium]MCB9919226.1 inorganic pyrophosphatase [Planctomycetota bacterium]